MQITPQQAQTRLTDGNVRFSSGAGMHEHTSPQRLREVAGGQEPFATVLTCSDSRVTPEILFDCGIGELFVIRNAGNILDETCVASVLYAVMHLATPLVVVLGHQSCGAVTAACAGSHGDSSEPPAIRSLKETIRENAGIRAHASDRVYEEVSAAIHANAQTVVGQLCGIPEIAMRCMKGSLLVTSAYFSFDDGSVTFLGECGAYSPKL